MSASLRIVPRPDLMEGFIADRAALAQSLDDSRAAAARVRNRDAEEQAIHAAIDALNAEHRDRITHWARSGAKGDMPAADLAEQQRLGQRLAAAQAGAAAAGSALAELDAASVTIAADLRALDARIADAALSDALATIAPTMAEARRIAAQAGEQVACAFGLVQAIRDRGATLQRQGRNDEAHPFFVQAERAAAGIESFTFEPTSADILRSAEDWRARLAAQTGGVFA